MSELRALIRELLTEELSRLRVNTAATQAVREEAVSLRTDAELGAFISRVLTMTQDDRVRADIAAGRYVFRLQRNATTSAETSRKSAPRSQDLQFDQGLITEKDVAKLPQDLRKLSVGATACLTPLAKDELRRRNIKIERRSG